MLAGAESRAGGGERRQFNESLSDLPVLNLAEREALIWIASPVLGLRPVRALRSETWKVPNPEMLTLSPLFKAATMSSKIVFTIRSATLFWSSIFDEMESISSALVMKTPFPTMRKNVGPALYQQRPEQSIPTLTPQYCEPDAMSHGAAPLPAATPS